MKTAVMWPGIRQAYTWVHQAVHLLSNELEADVCERRRAYRRLLSEMQSGQAVLGDLAFTVPHFRKVTKSYWPGLFHCYQRAGLPRTNNDLEQCFGSARHHERRATGRRGASPAMVVRGRVRLVAAVATQVQPMSSEDLQLANIEEWRTLRGELDARQETRRTQLRFRRDPDAYLRQLEGCFLQPSLPP
jgi:hypothetical protein